MPLGSKQDFNFKRSSPQQDTSTYRFYTGNTPSTQELGEVVAYNGCVASIVFYVQTQYILVLCENQDYSPYIFEYGFTCSDAVFYYASEFKTELTLYSESKTNTNFTLCEPNPYNIKNNLYVYGENCGDVIFKNGQVFSSPSLETQRNDVFPQYNLCGTLGDISAYNQIFDYSDVCEDVVFIHAASFDTNLETYPVPNLHNDFNNCYQFYGIQATPKPVLLTEPPDDNLELLFSNGIRYIDYEYIPRGCNHVPFRFYNMEHGIYAVFDISVDKNHQYDLTICTNETNPPADYSEEPEHIFEFKFTYPYECSEFIFDMYHGSNTDVSILESIEISDVVAFHGSYSDSGMRIFVRFQPIFYNGDTNEIELSTSPSFDLGDILNPTGATAESSLLTTQIFYDVDAYGGDVSEFDIDVPKPIELVLEHYHGAVNEIALETEPVIYLDSAYSGSTLITDELKTYPAIEISIDYYHGYVLESDVQRVPGFTVEYPHGHNASSSLETFESEDIGVVEIQHGIYADAYLAPTFNLPADAYHGAYATSDDLKVSLSIEFDFYGGDVAETDITENPPKELPADVYHGSSAHVDKFSVTVALFPRGYGGDVLHSDFVTYPGEEFGFVMYHGQGASVAQLSETDWNTRAYHGSYSTIDYLALAVNMPSDAYHGATSELDTIHYAPSLDVPVQHGIYAKISSQGFEVPEGEKIKAVAYHGANFYAEDDIRIHAILQPRKIVSSQTLYDGLGGVGGLNFCPTENLDPIYHDTAIRFEYDPDEAIPNDKLDIIFDDYGFRPWNPCSSHVVVFSVDLQTQPRFHVTYENTATSLEVYMPKEFLSFGNVDLDVLYSEDGSGGRHDYKEIRQPLFEVEFFATTNVVASMLDADDFYAIHDTGVTVELTPTKFSEFTLDTRLFVDLRLDHPDWRFEFVEQRMGSIFTPEFEPELYHRFCPGYITPVGNNVVLEFNETDVFDCYIYIAGAGSRMEFELENNIQFKFNMYNGNNTNAFLTTYKPWLLFAYHGQHFAMASEAILHPVFYHGSVVQGKFYVPPIVGFHGATASVDKLVVAGPAIQWITETQCLPNKYVPTTENGDPDYDAIDSNNDGIPEYPPVPVEKLPFMFPLLAICITYAESEGE